MELHSKANKVLTCVMCENLERLYERGNRLENEKLYEDAIQTWQEGLGLLYELQQDYEAINQFLAAIGDVYFLRMNMYADAYEFFNKDRGYGGYGNPFNMLRLGECCLELGDKQNAIEYLLRAYMMEGKEIFEPDVDGDDDGRKYFEFLKTYVNLNKSG